MKTIHDVLISFNNGLFSLYESREINSIAALVLNEVTGLSKAQIKAFPERELTAAASEKIKSILEALQTGQPVQYVLGKTEFYGLPFPVNPSVLIPRPETEELVEWIISSWQSIVPIPIAIGTIRSSGQSTVGGSQLAVDRRQPANILDIGTGSGCIAIALKKHLADVNVYAMDIAADALETAKSNAQLNETDINFIQADILNPPTHSPFTIHHSPFTTHYSPLTTSYSLIVSNPPYVTPDDKTKIHINVVNFEPHTALFVPQADPLLFYKAIADFAKGNLVKKGLLFLEINESYGQETVQLLAANGFRDIELRNDMNNKPRMVKAVL